MANTSQESLNELMVSLRNNDANEVVKEITTVIARGVTREEETEGKVKERRQTPLEPDEAYRVSLEILIASLEPLLMKRSVEEALRTDSNKDASAEWRQDFIEDSLIKPEEVASQDIPQIEPQELKAFENDLQALIALLEGEANGQL